MRTRSSAESDQLQCICGESLNHTKTTMETRSSADTLCVQPPPPSLQHGFSCTSLNPHSVSCATTENKQQCRDTVGGTSPHFNTSRATPLWDVTQKNERLWWPTGLQGCGVPQACVAADLSEFLLNFFKLCTEEFRKCPTIMTSPGRPREQWTQKSTQSVD